MTLYYYGKLYIIDVLKKSDYACLFLYDFIRNVFHASVIPNIMQTFVKTKKHLELIYLVLAFPILSDNYTSCALTM